MRLLNTATLELKDFIANVPAYAILSHTWGEEEVLFADIDKPHARSMAGYDKILRCCQQAQRDGFQWVWIDTCCIDKTSSAELSEAINSMYKWYWDAGTCYAYLSDVTGQRDESWFPRGHPGRSLPFRESRWFTRGWTLQELLAPSFVEFYDRTWQRLGTKSKLVDQIVYATRVEAQYLLDRDRISYASIATRFSWASQRETTRVEDMAYCLLGIVDINMPMLYGEGAKAFHRLQLEIIKQSSDHTIFAWDLPYGHEEATTDIFAPTVKAFANSADIHRVISERPTAALTYEMTNNGLRLNLPCLPVNSERMIAILDCADKSGNRCGIQLHREKGDFFVRFPAAALVQVAFGNLINTELMEFHTKATLRLARRTNEHAYVFEINERLWSHSSSKISQIAYRDSAWREFLILDTTVHLWNSSAFIVMSSHKHINKDREASSFTIILGTYRDSPTIRVMQGYMFPDTLDRCMPTVHSSLLELLNKDMHRYSRSYYRAQLCCGNMLEIDLRKKFVHNDVCWTPIITIQGDVTATTVPSSDSTCTMELDGDFKDGRWAAACGIGTRA